MTGLVIRDREKMKLEFQGRKNKKETNGNGV
ncbi:hypothetical protein CGLO_12356 [Colletotrichum gloeosporioides Cg-14]|uniref:Uncharacterized protein n=1 Tax=Colletotrichum gloeosporioides (strain Cg-14) TaxID=1237896 RepID=T0K8R0_COLGC|nr:hypothetical protein CGLO_12356 [Colletotrichum gloeosporioides Cg-14]